MPPGHPIQADTQVGMLGQAEDLLGVNQAEARSLADTVGLWLQQDIRADQPSLGGIHQVHRRRETPPWDHALEPAVQAQQEHLRLGQANRRGLSQQGSHPPGLQQRLASR